MQITEFSIGRYERRKKRSQLFEEALAWLFASVSLASLIFVASL